MTSIVRPAKLDLRARGRREFHSNAQAVIEAAERDLDDRDEITRQAANEARERLSKNRQREGS